MAKPDQQFREDFAQNTESLDAAYQEGEIGEEELIEWGLENDKDAADRSKIRQGENPNKTKKRK
jgi:hypothetical protein